MSQSEVAANYFVDVGTTENVYLWRNYMKKGKKIYTKNCKAGLTKDMWYTLSVMKAKLGKPKAQIIREAIAEYYVTHMSNNA